MDDSLLDTDSRGLPFPILTDAHARAYLNKDIPIRTHSIWTSLIAWNKDNVSLMSASHPNFHSWWKRFQLQASQHHLPPAVTWRLATWLLPEFYQDTLLQYLKKPDFEGFNIDSWAHFISRTCGGKDSAILAGDELRSLKPSPTDSL